MRKHYAVIAIFFALLLALPTIRHAMADDDDTVLLSDSDIATIASITPIQTSPLDLKLIAVGTVSDVPRENVIKFDNGTVYKLENIRVPVNYFPAAITYLKKTLIGKKVGIYARTDDKNIDRYDSAGNMMGHAVTIDGVWVQADMVSLGLAWVSSTPHNRDLVRPLYEIEKKARAAKLGLWIDPQYMLKDNKSIQDTYGSFQVYEGTVTNVSISSNYIFVNFGQDYSKDFTITFRRNVCKMFTDAPRSNLDPHDWIGHKIRIRGWVERHDGPMMQLSYPEQIEYPEPIHYTQ